MLGEHPLIFILVSDKTFLDNKKLGLLPSGVYARRSRLAASLCDAAHSVFSAPLRET